MKKLIFILDDENLVLESMEGILSRTSEYDIKTFSDPQKMLIDRDLHEVDLFIIDVVLDKFSGVDLTKSLTSKFPGIPFLLISGYENVDIRMLESETNLVDFVSKPFTRAVLENRISILLRASDKIRGIIKDSCKIEELYSKIFESNPVPVAITTKKDGRIVEVNQAFIDLVKYGRLELRGKTTKEIGIWQNPSDRDRLIEKLYKEGSLFNEESNIVDKNGDVRNCLFFGQVLHHSDETEVILTSAIDITWRKKMVEDLWALLNFSSFYVVVLDQDIKVRLCNRALAKFLGFEEETEVIGTNWLEFVPGAIKPIISHVVHRLKEYDPDYTEFTNEIVSKDGKELAVKWFNSYVNQTTHSIFSIGIPFKEITHQDTIESVRSYFKALIRKDADSIHSIKELAFK